MTTITTLFENSPLHSSPVDSGDPACAEELKWFRAGAAASPALETAAELGEVLMAALEWIDAVPKDVALPAMPGFDRDWAVDLLEKLKDLKSAQEDGATAAGH